MKNKILPYIVLFVALGLSSTAAYYSIIGLSKLFAGVALAVIIMSSFLEASKLIIASLLYQYWGTLNKVLRIYLTIALSILILITSMGIYGMLSSGYQDTYRQLTIKENQTKFLTQKKEFYEKDVIRYDTELERISNNISTLSNAKSSSIQIKDASVDGGLRTTISTSEVRLAQKRIGVEEENRKDIRSKREIASDSLQKYQLKILELENNTEVAGELGSLQYLSNLTGASMDKIINILLLIIIFVFDPLAISLVIAANFAFEKAYPKKKENLYGELVDDFSEWDGIEEEQKTIPRPSKEEIQKLEDTRDAILTKSGLYKYRDEIEKHTSGIGDPKVKEKHENLNIIEVEKYKTHNPPDFNPGGVVNKNEDNYIQNKIQELQNLPKQNLSGWRRKKIQDEIKGLKDRLDNNESKTY